MARLVEEIMNRELFTARPEDSAGELIEYFSRLGIGSSPVLARDGGLMGMISLRDLVCAAANTLILDLMRRPVTTVAATSSIEEAARILGETGYHRLPVLGPDQRVVGVVSSMDVLRGLRGMPARHPEAFPHYDEDTGLTWSDDVPLEMDRVEAAPDGSGLVALVHGGVGVRERVVWAEMTSNMRSRLIDMLSEPQRQYPALHHWLRERPAIRFRVVSLSDQGRGHRVVDQLQRRAGYATH